MFTNLQLEDISEDDIIHIISYLDTNEDGKLQYKEFLNLMSK